jgi:hypothetical protein
MICYHTRQTDRQTLLGYLKFHITVICYPKAAKLGHYHKIRYCHREIMIVTAACVTLVSRADSLATYSCLEHVDS